MNKRHCHKILDAKTDDEIKSLFPVLRVLIPTIKMDYLVKICRMNIDQEGCHFLYVKDVIEGETEPRPVSILSYRIMNCLFYGKHLHIHDVATIPAAKKKGYAGSLVDFAINTARQEKCNSVSLNSGYTRKDAQRLYLNKGFYMTDHHFTLDIEPISN